MTTPEGVSEGGSEGTTKGTTKGTAQGTTGGTTEGTSAATPAATDPAANPAPAAYAKDARNRLPREPYPGLRPFLDFEAALLFGREHQVQQIIAGLRETQFVAVLGGSGSGKSSLVHAGVVPALRSFGIPGAGDLWLPMTCTPGTNVSAEQSAARLHSPVTRLARRFAGLLKTRGSAAADTQRIDEIAQVFRQEAGFARLLDTYAGELAVPPGPDPADARVLFVLDQFEELFHPTNKGVADATLLVERVLDHFFIPHPHCYVVLTMRSEHLNDCATFLELPDAINKSSYLIRRLDDSELLEAITAPAQRFLRLVARSASAASGLPQVVNTQALPSAVVFEPRVLERLLRDIKAITHDPDHLPLLQHLLARLWQAALEREEMDVPVPATITKADLARAVSGGGGAGGGGGGGRGFSASGAWPAASPGDAAPAGGPLDPLDDSINTLRACAENWPTSIYRWQPEDKQKQLDALFRQLAFKDPNTGLYSQQRVDVDTAAALLGPGQTRADLRALIAEGFLGSVDYLFWDDEDPARVTLKVSHESFIRGWSHFRQLVDEESERFDEFVAVLRKSAAWVDSGRSEDFLLETGEMRRLRDSDFQRRLGLPGQRASWTRLLQLDRDGVRLARLQPQLESFLATSSARLQDRDKTAGRARRRWLVLGAITLLLLPSALFSVLIQAPVTERAELLFDAGNRANRAPLTPDYPGVGAAAAPLVSLLRAAELIDDARSGQSNVTARLSEWLLNHLAWIPPVRRQDAFLNGVAAQSEPPVNGKLRQLLSSALWHSAERGVDDAPYARPTVIDTACRPGPDQGGARDEVQGRLFVAAGQRAGNVHRRAVFVPVWSGDNDTSITLRGATYDTERQRCSFGQIVLAVPLYLNPSIVFDAGLRYFVYSAGGKSVDVPSVTLQEIEWERVEDQTSRVVQSQLRTVITDADAVEQVRRAAGVERVVAVPTWRQVGGRALDVGGQNWRLVAASAQRLPVVADDARFVPLLPAAAGSACARLPTGWAPQDGFRSQMFDDGAHCFSITRGNPAGEAQPGAPGTVREQVLVAVFERPDDDALPRLADNPPAPLASFSQFARVAPAQSDWMVGSSGDYAGWLALRLQGGDGVEGRAGGAGGTGATDATDATHATGATGATGATSPTGRTRLTGAPWSTCALWRLGQALLAQNMAPPSAASAASAASAPSAQLRSTPQPGQRKAARAHGVCQGR